MATAETTFKLVAFAVNGMGHDGTRCRGGQKFWPKDHKEAPESYVVTAAQLKVIKKDAVINVVKATEIKPGKAGS